MKRSMKLKLAEVEASYRPTLFGAVHRCGLRTCQQDGECAFPTRCVALPSDLSGDNDAAPERRILDLPEHIWRQEGESEGWEVPPRRSWWRRLPVIRHIAALWLSWQVHRYAGAWASVGIGLGGPHAQDLWVVEGAFHGYW